MIKHPYVGQRVMLSPLGYEMLRPDSLEKDREARSMHITGVFPIVTGDPDETFDIEVDAPGLNVKMISNIDLLEWAPDPPGQVGFFEALAGS